MSHLKIKWFDRGREPQNPPNPEFPDGKDIDMTRGDEPSCQIALPYPAKRCGYWAITCEACEASGVVTTAGRPDDPRSVRVPCSRRDAKAVH